MGRPAVRGVQHQHAAAPQCLQLGAGLSDLLGQACIACVHDWGRWRWRVCDDDGSAWAVVGLNEGDARACIIAGREEM